MASRWRLLTPHHLMKSSLLCRIRHHSDGGGLVLQTTLSRINVEEAAPLISAYNMQGFTLRGVRVMGSVALLPRGFFHWNVNSPDNITPDSMSIFTLIEPKLGTIYLFILFIVKIIINIIGLHLNIYKKLYLCLVL